MILWRLTTHDTLNGEGGRLYAARWNSGGKPIVYMGDSPASAFLEILVHLEVMPNEAPTDLVWLQITVPDNLKISILHNPDSDSWKSDFSLTRQLGDAWLKSNASPLIRVPSAILPFTFNYLYNPLHPDAAQIKISTSQPAFFDPRLLR